MNNKALVNKTSEFSGAKDLKNVYGDLFKYTESLEKRMPFRINLVRAAKAAIARSFEMVAETASSAGHADLGAYARLFKFNGSKHKLQLAKNFGSCDHGMKLAKLEGKTFACYKRSTFPDFSKIMPKSKEFQTTTKSKPARIVVNFPVVKGEIINLLRSIAGSPDAPLDRNRLKEVSRSEARAIEYVIIEVTALIIAPIMAHEVDHHAFSQSLDRELFSPVDHEGADPGEYWNSFFDVAKSINNSAARKAASEHRAIDLMPDFNSALVASYGKDLEQALSRWPSDDIRQIRDVVFSIITKKHSRQSTSGQIQKDKLYNLPPGWENRYGHLMRNRSKQISKIDEQIAAPDPEECEKWDNMYKGCTKHGSEQYPRIYYPKGWKHRAETVSRLQRSNPDLWRALGPITVRMDWALLQLHRFMMTDYGPTGSDVRQLPQSIIGLISLWTRRVTRLDPMWQYAKEDNKRRIKSAAETGAIQILNDYYKFFKIYKLIRGNAM